MPAFIRNRAGLWDSYKIVNPGVASSSNSGRGQTVINITVRSIPRHVHSGRGAFGNGHLGSVQITCKLIFFEVQKFRRGKGRQSTWTKFYCVPSIDIFPRQCLVALHKPLILPCKDTEAHRGKEDSAKAIELEWNRSRFEE